MIDIIEKYNENGYIYLKKLKENNIPTIYVTRLCQKGVIRKVTRGVYIISNYIEDDLYINYLKNKDLIYTKNTALYLHNLSLKQFDTYQANFLYGKNVSRIKNIEYNILRNKEIFELGKTYVETAMGNLVPCYDKERAICNLFMSDFCDEEVKCYAINEYKNNYLNINKLYEYSKKLNIYEKVKNVFEVLLWE